MHRQSHAIIPAPSFNASNFKLIAPVAVLRPWVQCLWTATTGSLATLKVNEKLYPDGGSSLTFLLRNTELSVHYDRDLTVKPMAWLPETFYLCIRFKPGGASVLLGERFGFTSCCMGVEAISMLSYVPNFQRFLDGLQQNSPSQALWAVQQWLVGLCQTAHRQAMPWVQLISRAVAQRRPLPELAADEGIGRRTLERQFKHHLGMTPKQAYRFIQMRKARQLLGQSMVPLSEVALMCGFFDQAHFTNVFHTQVLETPADYRKRKLSQISNPSAD